MNPATVPHIGRQRPRTVYSAALSVVGIAICRANAPPDSCCRLYMIALVASTGEPPPTATTKSAPASLYALIPALIPAMGECSPISQNVAPYAFSERRTASTFLTTSVYRNRIGSQAGGFGRRRAFRAGAGHTLLKRLFPVTTSALVPPIAARSFGRAVGRLPGP